jgi:hypothetical protein
MVKRKEVSFAEPASTFLSALVQQEWRNPEARAVNLQIARAVGLFVAGIVFFRQAGSTLVPLIA